MKAFLKRTLKGIFKLTQQCSVGIATMSRLGEPYM